MPDDSNERKSLKELMEDLVKLSEGLGSPPLPVSEQVKQKLISKALESTPKVPKFNWATPLRRNLDYQSVGRKTFIMDDLGFRCGKCGLHNPKQDYSHSDEECAVHGVMES